MTTSAKCGCGQPAYARGLCRVCYGRAWKARRMSEDGRAALDLPPLGFRTCVAPRETQTTFGPAPTRARRWVGRELGWMMLVADVLQVERLEAKSG